MNCKNCAVFSVLLTMIVASRLCAQEYQITLESNDEEVAVVELSIRDGTASTKVGDAIERFDLKQQRWEDDESKQWVTLSQCEAWARQSKERSSKSKESIPETIRPFLLWSLDPTFEIAATDTTLTLTSGQVDYKIVGERTNADLKDYFRYSKLNAYKKAMTQKKLPPFAELRVIEELERRKLMPTSMDIEIPGVPGAPRLKARLAAKPR